MRKGWVVLAAAVAMTLSACGDSRREPQLMNLRTATDGPDEFSILPPKGLELPPDLAALPEPTPGGTNLTDRNPRADAILALGGKPGAGAGDQALLAHASRLGVTSGIRETLAAEDLRWRQKNGGRPLERLFRINTYFQAYKRYWLDVWVELERWRAAGVQTPSAPPKDARASR